MGFFDFIFKPYLKKFRQGVDALKAGRPEQALHIFEEIKNRYCEVAPYVTEARYQLGMQHLQAKDSDKALDFFFGAMKSREEFPKASNTKDWEVSEQKVGEQICQIAYDKGLHFSNQKNEQKAREWLHIAWQNAGPSRKQIKEKAAQALSRMDVSAGKGLERKGKMTEAAEAYRLAMGHFQGLNMAPAYYEAMARNAIVQIKQGIRPDAEVFESLQKVENIKLRQDLCFRYALYLAKAGEWLEAQQILDGLKAEGVAEIGSLGKFLHQQISLKARDELAEWNDLLAGSDPKAWEMWVFGREKAYTYLPAAYPEYAKQLPFIKPFFMGKLLKHFFEHSEYSEVIRVVTAYPEFLNHPPLLQNLALACLRMTTSGRLDAAGYRKIISTWLTCIHHTAVAAVPLESATWLDGQTFTHKGALDPRPNQPLLAGQINNLEPSSGNHSIGESQKILAQAFEEGLRSLPDPALSAQALEFYFSEKAALVDAMPHLPAGGLSAAHLGPLKDMGIATNATPAIHMVAAPFFASEHYKLDDTIQSALSNAYFRSKNEDILEAAIPYCEHSSQQIFDKYKSAKLAANRLRAFVEAPDLTTRKKDKKSALSTVVDCDMLQDFPQLLDQVEKDIIDALSKVEALSPPFDQLEAVFADLYRLLPFAQKFTYQYSEFLLGHYIDQYNQEKIASEPALAGMVKAYKVHPSNHRAASNMAILVKNCLLDVVNEEARNKEAIFTQIKDIRNMRNDDLKNIMIGALGDFWDELLDMSRKKNNVDELIKAAAAKYEGAFDPYAYERQSANSYITEHGYNLGRVMLNLHRLIF